MTHRLQIGASGADNNGTNCPAF